ncbi:uncharacterized protein LOC120316337 isoform X2 [Crotalus tigris]|nr:uncharacterized protein LOC120316337 isoform X2 [Crotalus tigris]XP_039217758.1 uncharacterized protein LOC120316337 isoform X2 [Crotalus tigris]XP_039217764.1 uncharacterized protein LOC120316337 isoform X2 [Crotalus tigris]XP_039217774.1 uncharacterized protein LOC120316337 isoform X2 [Crotalus tigris]
MSHLCHTIVPLLAGIHEHNVIFVMYTSECNPSNPHIMKELLIKTLYSLGSRLMDSMFNIIWCSSKVLKWQNELVECSLTNIMDAASWIRTLQMNSKAKANAWNAIEEAIKDPSCQAIYLFTSGLPEGRVEEICSRLKETKQLCPVHIVQLVENGEDNKISCQKLLVNIAKMSGGTFQAIDGASCEDKTDCNLGFHHAGSIGNHLSFPPLTDHCTKQFPLGTWSPDTCNTCLRSSMQENLGDCSTNSHHLLRGIRVLARKQTDGYYYLSHIVQKVKDSNEHVLVEFERCQRLRKGKPPFRRQEVPLYDIIHYDDARWQPLSAGDGTLAPWEKNGRRYGPGIVLQVAETRSDYSAFQNSKVLINFWNGQTKTISADVAVRIPLLLYERIVLELQMPLTARQLLVEQNPDYPSVVPPGYRASEPCRQNHLPWMPWPQTPKIHCIGVCGSNTHFSPWSFCCPLQNHSISPISSTWADDALIPRVSPSKEELSKKLEDQFSKGTPPTLENDKNAKEDSSKQKTETNLADAKSWEEKEIKVVEPSKDQKAMDSEDTMNNTGTMVDIATNTGKWTTQQKQNCFLQPNLSGSLTQLSQRNTSQKTYFANNSKLQDKLDWVDRSLKKDRLAIESVLHMRRSYSAPPSGQRLIEKEAPWDGPRDVDANPTKINFKRQKWEQRQLKKEQQQQESHHKREMRLENKRQQFLQRTLQGSQKLQEQNDRAERHLEQLREATAERRRQESHLWEEEGKKDNQRKEFLKAQHKQREKQLAKYNQMIDDQEKKRLALLRNRKEVMQKNAEIALKEQEAENKKKEAANCQRSQKREQILQNNEKERQMQKGLLQYLREQDLLLLRASMLP